MMALSDSWKTVMSVPSRKIAALPLVTAPPVGSGALWAWASPIETVM